MSKQKWMLVYSAVIPSIAAILLFPLLSRLLSPSFLGTALTILMMNGVFGAFDVLRPVYISFYSNILKTKNSIEILPSIKLSFATSFLVSIAIYLLIYFFLQEKISGITSIAVAFGGFSLLFSNVFWAILDSTARTGTAQAIKSTLTILLYISFAILAIINANIAWYATFFAFIQILQILLFWAASRRYITWRNSTDERQPYSSIWHTVKLNAAKLAIDFSDRLVIGKLGSEPLSNAYLIIYDFTSKLNIATQYINVYAYPLLCRKVSQNEEYLQLSKKLIFLASAIYLGIAALSVAFTFYGNQLLSVYLGEAFNTYGSILSFLTLIAANYSLAFYGQSIFRAEGKFEALSRLYIISATIGVIIGVAALLADDVKFALLMILMIKSPGLMAYLELVCRLTNSLAVTMLTASCILVLTTYVTNNLLQSIYLSVLYAALLTVLSVVFSGVLRNRPVEAK